MRNDNAACLSRSTFPLQTGPRRWCRTGVCRWSLAARRCGSSGMISPGWRCLGKRCGGWSSSSPARVPRLRHVGHGRPSADQPLPGAGRGFCEVVVAVGALLSDRADRRGAPVILGWTLFGAKWPRRTRAAFTAQRSSPPRASGNTARRTGPWPAVRVRSRLPEPSRSAPGYPPGGRG